MTRFPETMLPEKTFAASTIPINYAEGPDNGPPMVLIHGLGGRWTSWKPVIDQFAEEWHVYAIDLRGHGGSGRVPGAYTFDDYPGEVIEFLREVVRRPAHLIGASLGGIASAGVCARAPGLVAAAVLVDPPLYIREWFIESGFAAAFKKAIDIRSMDLDEPGTVAELRKYDPTSSDESLAIQAATLVRADPGIWAAALDGRQTESWNPDAVLSAVTSPCC